MKTKKIAIISVILIMVFAIVTLTGRSCDFGDDVRNL